MPMMGGAFTARPDPPQYAQFEVGKNGLAVTPTPLSEDALPPMPSWETAQKRRVVDETAKDDVELGELNPSTGQKVPLMSAGAAPGSSMPPSPVNDVNGAAYNTQTGQGTQNGYIGAATSDPYAQSQTNLNMGYGAQSSGVAGVYNSSPPQDMYNNQSNNYGGAAAAPMGYNRPQRQNTGERSYNNNNPRGNGYGAPPQMPRQYTGTSSRTGYSDRSNYSNPQGPQQRGPSRGPGTPMNNNGNRMQSPNYDQSYSSQGNYQPQSNRGANNDYYDNSQQTYNSRGLDTRQQGYGGQGQYSGYDNEVVAMPTPQRRPVGGGGGQGRREPQQGWDPVGGGGGGRY